MLLLIVPVISVAQVTDIDGTVYKTVVIGDHEWMVENLNLKYMKD